MNVGFANEHNKSALILFLMNIRLVKFLSWYECCPTRNDSRFMFSLRWTFVNVRHLTQLIFVEHVSPINTSRLQSTTSMFTSNRLCDNSELKYPNN